MAFSVQVLVDWDNDGDYVDTYDDVWDDVRSVRWSNGMRKGGDRMASESECTLELVNTDGKYNPENTSGVLFGNLLPYRPVRVVVDIGAGDVIMWQGAIESIEPDWRPAGALTGKQYARIRCVGAKQFIEENRVVLDIQDGKRSDEIIAAALAAAPQLPFIVGGGWRLGLAGASELGVSTILMTSSEFQDLETGKVTYTKYGVEPEDKRDKEKDREKTVWRIIRDMVDGEDGRFFFDRVGRAIFWNRDHMQTDISDVGSVTEDDTGEKPTGVRMGYGKTILNSVIVHGLPFDPTPGNFTTLWSLPAQITLQAEPSQGVLQFPEGPLINPLEIEIEFTDANGQPTGATDVQVSSQVPGAGELGIEIEPDGDRATLRLSNLSYFVQDTLVVTTDDTYVFRPVLISTLDIIGRPVPIDDKINVKRSDGDSIATNGRYELELKTYLEDPSDAQALADHILVQYSEARNLAERITFRRSANGVDNAHLINWDLGGRIRVQLSSNGHDQDYFIMGEEHSLTQGGTLHETTFILEAAPLVQYWVLGTADIGELEEQTRVGF